MTPLRIHVVGAHETNAPWAFELRVIEALRGMGHDAFATDSRRRRDRLPELLARPADLVLACRGDGIPAGLLWSVPAPTVLWYAELLGTLDRADARAEARRAELATHVAAFDFVLLHEPLGVPVATALGARAVGVLPTAVAVPGSRREPGEPDYDADVLFLGTVTPRRERFLDALAERVDVVVAQVHDPAEAARRYSRSRVVLNLHLSDLPNTETRVGEVLSAGACLLTEELSDPGLLAPDVEVATFPLGDVEACAATARALLADESRRCALARAGRDAMLTRHTLEGRLARLLDIVDPEGFGAVWPPTMLGLLRDAAGDVTRCVRDFDPIPARTRKSPDEKTATCVECKKNVKERD